MRLRVFIFTIFILLISIFSVHLIIKLIFVEKPHINYFIISSGSEGGNYYKAGLYIEKALNNISRDKYVFKVIPSGGSIENIERLKNRFADFAIVQRDILLKNYFGDGEKIKNVTVVSPLFQEKFLIYMRGDKNMSFTAFKEIVKNSKNKTNIGITKKGGAAHKTFINISNLLGLSLRNIDFIEGSYDNIHAEFNKNNIDFLLVFSLPLVEMERSDISKIYFSNDDIKLIISRMRYFSIADVSGHVEQNTLGVWAVLIGLNSSIGRLGDNKIIKSLTSNKKIDNYISDNIKYTLDYFKKDKDIYYKYLSSLPTSSELKRSINIKDNGFVIYSTPIVFLVLIFIYYYRKLLNNNKRNWNYIWVRYNHIIIGSILIVIAYILCIEYLIYVEQEFFRITATKSRILDLTRNDLHAWNLIRIFAQNDAGFFPVSLYGKLITTLSTYVIFFGAALIVTSEFVIYKLTARRREGLSKVNYMNHVIISGWNSNTPKLIRELLSAASEYHKKSFRIVGVVTDPEHILKSNLDISMMEHERILTLVKGDLRNRDVAEQCKTHSAAAIILLAEDNTINADEKTLLRALSVTKFNCKLRENNIESFDEDISSILINKNSDLFNTRKDINTTYIIAEINNESFSEDLSNAGVNGIVNRGKIIEGILVQSFLNPGVSTLLNNILSFSGDTNEFYTVNLMKDENKHLRNKTFDELLLPLRRNNILLIAIKIVYLDEMENEIVDEEQISKLLYNDKLSRQIITNPISNIETSRRVDNDDQLIVLAVNIHKLQLGIKNMLDSDNNYQDV